MFKEKYRFIMLTRFIKYYKPHIWLFILDISTAITAALLAMVIPFYTRELLKTYLPQKDIRLIFITLGIMLGVIIIKALLSYIRVRWGHVLGVRMEADMRSDFFSHLQKLSFNYFDNIKTGHLMSRISNDLSMIAEIAHHCPEDLIISIFMIIGAFVFMFIFSIPLAFIALIPIPIMLAWGILYGGMMRKGFRSVRRKIADINSSVENSVQGIREVKSYANEYEEISKFEQVNFNFRIAKEKMYNIMATFFSGMQFLSEGYFLLVIAGGAWLIWSEKILIADLLAFVLYIHFILKPIQRLVTFTEQLQQGAAAFERFIEVMDIDPDIVDSKSAHTIKVVKGEISFTNVFFKYSTSTDWILKDINLQISAGVTVAFVGESGAGKSTVASLIPRFYEPQQGVICIDNHNIMNLKQKFLRENIGLVNQNVFLFDSTIRENIMYGNLNADEEQLVDASKQANIYDFIKTLPEGFDSLVGERGVKLSGGQKQRISIARVFLKNPPIFIFDEATSSLDTESESLIQKSLELLSQNRTTIIIAHRLSTIRAADKLFVIKEGKIVEEGIHTQLLAKKQYYHKLYTQ